MFNYTFIVLVIDSLLIRPKTLNIFINYLMRGFVG